MIKNSYEALPVEKKKLIQHAYEAEVAENVARKSGINLKSACAVWDAYKQVLSDMNMSNSYESYASEYLDSKMYDSMDECPKEFVRIMLTCTSLDEAIIAFAAFNITGKYVQYKVQLETYFDITQYERDGCDIEKICEKSNIMLNNIR